jgi:hypothetical protein
MNEAIKQAEDEIKRIDTEIGLCSDIERLKQLHTDKQEWIMILGQIVNMVI